MPSGFISDSAEAAAFREGVLVFNQAGALPGPALKQVIDAVKGLNMEEVHAQVAKLHAEHQH